MNIGEFAQFLAKHQGEPVSQQQAQQYLVDIDKTIDEAVAMLEEFDAYLDDVEEAEMPDTSTPEGKLHHAKLNDPFS